MFDAVTVGEWLTHVLLPGAGVVLLGVLFQVARRWLIRMNDGWLKDLLEELVTAAEQMYGPGRGDDKRRYVLAQMKARGVSVEKRPPSLEAAVYRLPKDGE